MNLPDQIQKESLAKIVETANKMLNEEVNLVKGSVEIYKLKGNINDTNNKIFDIFTLVASDTDHIPLNEDLRKKWNHEALQKLDKELDEYIKDMKSDIIKASKQVVEKFS